MSVCLSFCLFVCLYVCLSVSRLCATKGCWVLPGDNSPIELAVDGAEVALLAKAPSGRLDLATRSTHAAALAWLSCLARGWGCSNEQGAACMLGCSNEQGAACAWPGQSVWQCGSVGGQSVCQAPPGSSLAPPWLRLAAPGSSWLLSAPFGSSCSPSSSCLCCASLGCAGRLAARALPLSRPEHKLGNKRAFESQTKQAWS